MKKHRSILNWISTEIDLPDETFPGQSIVELAGDRRVLIENHFGVTQYSGTQIGVKMKYGRLLICGCGLELAKMTKEQLVITGRIDSINVQRRNNT